MNYGAIVIGAHTGEFLKEKLSSYINKKNILIEPVFHNHNKLRENFTHFTDTQFLDCAISNIDEIKKFYYIKEESVKLLGKHWASGIGSFSKQHILAHKNKRFQVSDKDIETKDVQFYSFNSFRKKFMIEKVDLLQIDAEGAEFDIMNNIDYSNVDIQNIFFEKKHFDGPFLTGEKLQTVKQQLITAGYKLHDIDEENILAKKS